MVAEQQFDKYMASMAQGRKLRNPATRALLENEREARQLRSQAWGQSFSVYAVIMGAWNATFEHLFVNIKDSLVPNPYTVAACKTLHPKRSNQDKKAYKKMIDKWLRIGTTDKDGKQQIPPFPYYSQEVNAAIKNFNPSAFEDWASKHLEGDMSLVENTLDAAIDAMQKDMIILRYSIKNEMDAMRLPDAEIRSQVYTLYVIGQQIELFHLAFMLIGPMSRWEDLFENCDFIKTVDRLTAGGTSRSYNKEYHDQMNDALCYWNIRYSEQMYKAVCGQWTHAENGLTAKALEAIRRHVTDGKFVENISNTGIMTDPEYQREVEQIQKLWIYESGKIPYTILHMDALKHMNEGWTLEEIDKWLTDDPMVHTTEAERKQILLTCALIQAIEDGRLDADVYNEAYRKGSELNAHRTEEEKQQIRDTAIETRHGGDDSIISKVADIVDAMVAGTEQLKEEKEKEAFREEVKKQLREDPLLRLSQKFNVTAMKEKKPKQQKAYKPKAATKQEQPKPEEPKQVQDPPTVEAPIVSTPAPSLRGKAEEEATLPMTPTPPSPRVNRVKWTAAEEDYLVKHHNDPMPALVKHYWRTEASIRSKITRMTKDGKFKVKPQDPQINFTE